MIIAEGYEWTANEDGSYTTNHPYFFGKRVTAHALPVEAVDGEYAPVGDYGDKWDIYTMLHPDLSNVPTIRIVGQLCVFYVE